MPLLSNYWSIRRSSSFNPPSTWRVVATLPQACQSSLLKSFTFNPPSTWRVVATLPVSLDHWAIIAFNPPSTWRVVATIIAFTSDRNIDYPFQPTQYLEGCCHFELAPPQGNAQSFNPPSTWRVVATHSVSKYCRATFLDFLSAYVSQFLI